MGKAPLDPVRLRGLRAKLEAKRETLVQRLGRGLRWGLGEPLRDSVGELSAYDNQPADLGAETFEREKDLGLIDNTRLLLARIDHALERIEGGEYGWCENCGAAIDPKRLEAVPETSFCRRCQEEQDIPDRYPRPIEEWSLQEPFARSFRDETGDNAYDGEDAWQDVARYGGADSPQDVPGAVDYETLYEDSREKRGVVQEVEGLVDHEKDLVKDRERARRQGPP